MLRECLIAFVALATFVFAGQPFLETLGLSDTSLQIGGGVVLMLVALRMVFPSPEGVYGTSPGGDRCRAAAAWRARLRATLT